MRSKFGWNRPPVTASIWLRTYSRSRKAKKTGVIAPTCTPMSPRNSPMFAMRAISKRRVRIQLRPRRRLDPHQLFGGEDERHLVGEAAQPVDAVDQRGDLRVRADLGELLVAAVHVAHDRLGRDDLLAVEPGDDPQRAVGRRVLRADVEGHALGLELDVDPGVGGLRGDVARASGGRSWRSCRASPSAPSRRRRPRRSSSRHGLDVDDARPRLDHAGEQREVLAQREATSRTSTSIVVKAAARDRPRRASPREWMGYTQKQSEGKPA